MHRLQLDLRPDVHTELKKIAEQEGETVTAIIRKFINLGIYIKQNPDKLDKIIIL